MIKSDMQIIHLFRRIRVFARNAEALLFLFEEAKTCASEWLAQSVNALVLGKQEASFVWWSKRYANLLSSLIDTWHIQIKSWANSIYAVIVAAIWC